MRSKTIGASNATRKPEVFRNSHGGAAALGPAEDPRVLIHELSVHQAELEMQNQELQRMQLEIARSRDRYNDLYDFAPVCFVTLDRDGIILEANLTAATMLGIERALLVGRKFINFVSLGSQDRFHAHCKEVQESNNKKTCELTVRRRDGTHRTVQLESISAGDPTEQRTAFHDITIMKERSAQLQDLAMELSLAAQRERDRMAQLLHDHVQQLLFAATLELSRIGPRDSIERDGESVGIVRGFLSQAIEAIRSLSVEMSPPVLHQGLVASLSWLAEWMLRTYDLQVDLMLDPAAQPLDEPTCLLCFQAVRELLLNVVKHSHMHSALVTMKTAGDYGTSITVSDQGVGFDSVKQTSDKNHRLTFGLANLEHRIQLIGGSVRIESTPRRGTVATIWVPREYRHIRGKGTHNAHPISIFVVCDHSMVRESIARALALENDFLVVDTAPHGTTAVEKIGRSRPKVVIMDIRTPPATGIDTTSRIRRLFPKVRIIGLSTDESPRPARFEGGAIAYCRKTVSLNELIDTIRNVAGDGMRSVAETKTAMAAGPISAPAKTVARHRTAAPRDRRKGRRANRAATK